MKPQAEKLNWSDIYERWRIYYNSFNRYFTDGPQFLQIEVERTFFYRRSNVTWIPKCYFNPNTNHYIPQINAGTLRTAELLYEARGNLEMQHAIYIWASLKDKMDDVPENWRGKTAITIREMQSAILDHLPDLKFSWHHASREALPVSIFRGGHNLSESLLTPKNEFDVIYITMLETVLTEGTWQLVEYVEKKPYKLQLVEKDN